MQDPEDAEDTSGKVELDIEVEEVSARKWKLILESSEDLNYGEFLSGVLEFIESERAVRH